MLPERRSSFVLNTTISEMILLLFFLLLLLLVYAYIRNAEVDSQRLIAIGRAAEAEKAVADLKVRVDRLQSFYDRIVARLPDADKASVADTLVALDKLKASILAMDKKKEELEKDILAHEALIERLKSNIPVAQIPDKMRKEIGDLASCKKATEQLPVMQSKSKELETDNKNLRDIAKDAIAQAARCGGKGEEYVACWRDRETKKIQYVFDVFLDGKSVRVGRRWPADRQEEMNSFPVERSLEGRTVTVEEFLHSTQAIFAKSVGDNCRHFVVIHGDRRKMDGTMFEHFIRVQDHFYKQSNIK
ncbi:MAG: hypothetical protein A3G81_02205 [Betaproteobacteria bacterium RIFCSPLOWO2_12_FULL_65_14]|nr:MAG: hypothetical protein A3G81_02205 [Betaproteobacteria bacterium RIFCSPLOWO2_12_FULL_65_14]